MDRIEEALRMNGFRNDPDVIDGREAIAAETLASPSEIRGFLAATFRRMIGMSAFRECVEGNMSPAKSHEEALLVLIDQLEQMAQLEI